MKPRISMVALGVNNLDESIKFYRDGLGLPMLDSPPGVAFFNLNGSWLGLSNRESLAKDAGISSQGNGYSGMNLAHNVSSEKEVTEVLGQAVEAGATLVKRAQKSDWGGFHGYFHDLDGHLWEVAYNPFAWVGPAD
ncbi:MAG: VOC family protein [Cyclobacteriaceae bacterium]|nr:VOC family protein [Cyclobacteriaceae bacterium]